MSLKPSKLFKYKLFKPIFKKDFLKRTKQNNRLQQKKIKNQIKFPERLYSDKSIGCKMCNNYQNCRKRYENGDIVGCFIE